MAGYVKNFKGIIAYKIETSILQHVSMVNNNISIITRQKVVKIFTCNKHCTSCQKKSQDNLYTVKFVQPESVIVPSEKPCRIFEELKRSLKTF